MRAIRLEAGLKQEFIGPEIGVSRETINAWENDRTSPTIRDLEAFLRFCGKSIEDFFCSHPQHETDPDRELYWNLRQMLTAGTESERAIRDVIATCFKGMMARLQGDVRKKNPKTNKQHRKDGTHGRGGVGPRSAPT